MYGGQVWYTSDTARQNKEHQHVLNRVFPQNRSACVYPYACSFNSICNGSTDIEQQLIDLGPRALGLGVGFKEREPNHDETFED